MRLSPGGRRGEPADDRHDGKGEADDDDPRGPRPGGKEGHRQRDTWAPHRTLPRRWRRPVE